VSRNATLGFLGLALVCLHFLLHVSFGLEGVAPDLLTLALLLLVRETGTGLAAALGFFMGVLEDAFSVLAFGASALAMTIVGILGARTRELFVGDSALFLAVYLTAGKFLKDLIYWVVAGDTVREPFVKDVILDGGLGAIYLAAVGLVLVFFLGERQPLV
jgi:rod shape-determining protein MreD